MALETKRFVLRLKPQVYDALAREAKKRSVSMNDLLGEYTFNGLYGDGRSTQVDTPRAEFAPMPDRARPTAASLAARFGLTTAATLEADPDAAKPAVFDVGNAPVEDVEPSRNWLKFYQDMAEMEPSEAQYEFGRATAGVKLPTGFRKMQTAKQVQWLQNNA